MRKFLFMVVITVCILSLSSCLPSDLFETTPEPDPNATMPETIDELYSYYKTVSRGMTKSEVSELFGEGEENTDISIEGRFIKYINDKKSAGVIVEYTSDEVVRAKTLYFNSKETLSKFSPQFDSSVLPNIKEKMQFSKAVEIIGSEPLEINCEYSINDPIGLSNIFAWYNTDGKSYHLHTENGIIKNRVLYGN